MHQALDGSLIELKTMGELLLGQPKIEVAALRRQLFRNYCLREGGLLMVVQLCFLFNHYYNKILKSDWLSTVLISALIGQCNRTVHCLCALKCPFFTAGKKKLSGFLLFEF